MDGDRRGGIVPVLRRRWVVVLVCFAAGLLALGAAILVMLQLPQPQQELASGPAAAPAEGEPGGCDPATINRDNPAAGGIGPDCKYYPPIVTPPKEFPDVLFVFAHDRYVGKMSEVDPAAGREEVMLAVLRLSPEEMEAHRRYAIERRWNRRFLADLDDAMRWGESLRSADPQHVYDLAKSFRAAGQAGSAPQFAAWLHHLAMDKDLPEAIFDDALPRLDDPDRLNRVTAWHALRRIAMRGYEPALTEIVTRLREGRAYPPDVAELFFWLLRSQQAGLPVDDEIGRVQLRLSAELQAWVRHWLKQKKVPVEFGQ